MNNKNVAISQPYIILGGRLQVILGIVKALNNLGIEPHILTLGTSFNPQKIQSNYGQELRMHFRTILKFFPWKFLPQDYQILVFNFLLNFFSAKYSLIIDSSNSQIFLPKNQKLLSYIHYPRECRIKKTNQNQKKPSNPRELYSSLSAKYLSFIYRVFPKNIRHEFVCNSTFTRNALIDCYPELKEKTIPVIYPPVKLSSYEREKAVERQGSLVSLGRFAPDKKQLEQIRMAMALPDIDFHILGFVNNSNYYKKCEEFVRENNLKNVFLYPNAPFSEVVEKLNSSKYFLHLLTDEPFGITAVQAIAAGCIPLVHDSGGQVETVPIDSLRYQKFEEIPTLIHNLEKKGESEITSIQTALLNNAKANFDEEIFLQKVTKKIIELLPE